MVSEFVSQLEQLMQCEELRFNATLGFGRYKRFLEHAIAHPAKMNTKLLKFLIKNFTKEGETVLDPMCGSGSTGVIAALCGRNAVQVDIEKKFVDWAEKAKQKVVATATLTPKGSIQNICGDSRKLSTFMEVLPFMEVSFEDIIIALSIGDGSLCLQKYAKNPFLRFEHSSKQKEYFDWKVAIAKLKGLDGKVSYRERVRKGTLCRSFYFTSPSDERLLPIYNLVYRNKKKRITPELLSKLTPSIQAIWFMDDGGRDRRHENGSIFLATDSYPKEDVELLSSWFDRYLGIKSTIIKHGKGWILWFGVEASYQLKELLLPCFHSSMLYKINVKSGEKYQQQKLPKLYLKEYWAKRRKLSDLLRRETDVVVTSPPYSETISKHAGGPVMLRKGFKRGITTDTSRSYLPHGSVDAIVTSPPYADAKKGEADEEAMAERWDKTAKGRDWNTWGKTWKTEGRRRGLKSLGSGYSRSEENIGNLPFVDTVITSPPYAGTLEDRKGSQRGFDEGKGITHDGRKSAQGAPTPYSTNKENIGNLPFIDTVITSPPYGESTIQDYATSNKALLAFERKVRKSFRTKGYFEYKGRKYTEEEWRKINKGELKPRGIPELWAQIVRQREERKYNEANPQNIANLEHGKVDAVITSPPYEGSVSKRGREEPRERIAERLRKAGKSEEYIKQYFSENPTDNKMKGCGIEDKYSDSKQNIGNLPFQADTVITSPPYSEGVGHGRGKDTKLQTEKRLYLHGAGSYSQSENNIGEVRKHETYLEAMLKVYFEMHKVLKSNGLAIIVVKPFIRNKKVIDLPYQTLLLLQKIGFQLTKLYKLRLQTESFWRILYAKKHKNVPKIKHEYVIIVKKA